MRRDGRWRATVVAALLVACGLLAGAPAAYAEDEATEPVPLSLVATPAVGKPGTSTLIQGSGWPASTPYVVSTCGNNALNGDADCDTAGGISGTTNADGTFTARGVLTAPPKPCPCVLFAHANATTGTVRFPVEIKGHPVATPTMDGGTRGAELTASVEGSGPWQSWFGAAAERELVLTITNTGSLGLDNPPTLATIGRGDDPTDLLMPVEVGGIAPGQAVEVRVPFELSALSFGTYTVKVTMQGIDIPASASSTTSTYPWGLIVVAWLVLQIPLLGLWGRREPEPDPNALLDLNDPFRGLAPTPAAAQHELAVAGVPGWAAGTLGLASTGTLLLEAESTPPPAAVAPPHAPAPVVGAPLAGVPDWAAGAFTADVVASVGATAAGASTATNGAAPAATNGSGPDGRYGIGHLRRFVEESPTGAASGAPVPRVVVAGDAEAGLASPPDAV